jgi:hypothetical protein
VIFKGQLDLHLITVYFTITPKFSLRRIVLRVDKSSLVLNVNVISVLMPLLSIFQLILNHFISCPYFYLIGVRLGLWCLTPLWHQYFSYIVEETRVPGENHRPDTSHWQTLSHNVVSSSPCMNWIRTHNISGDRVVNSS